MGPRLLVTFPWLQAPHGHSAPSPEWSCVQLPPTHREGPHPGPTSHPIGMLPERKSWVPDMTSACTEGGQHRCMRQAGKAALKDQPTPLVATPPLTRSSAIYSLRQPMRTPALRVTVWGVFSGHLFSLRHGWALGYKQKSSWRNLTHHILTSFFSFTRSPSNRVCGLLTLLFP